MYGNKLTQDHGRLAFHHIFGAAKYYFLDDDEYHPPLNPLRIVLPLGTLTMPHLCTLLHSMDMDALIHNRDNNGMLPIHIACLPDQSSCGSLGFDSGTRPNFT